MKKFTYLATALLVLAGAASCQKNADVQEPGLQPSGKMRTVTIQAGQGATKTSVGSKGVLTWSEGDQLSIVPTSGSIGDVALDITSGVGEATGTFTGDIDDAIKNDTQLYGWCGGDWTYKAGSFSINMPSEQTYVSNGLAEDAYPSIGSGSIQNGITLSNPFGVLKLVVKGTGSAKTITVVSTAKPLAGSFTVDPSSKAVSGGESNTITLKIKHAVTLSADGVPFYVIVPPAEYAAKDLTVTVKDADGDIVVTSTLGTTEVKASNATAKYVQNKPTIKDVCNNTYPIVTIGSQTWMAENLRCNTYDTKSEAYNASWLTDNTIPTSEESSSEYTPYYTDATKATKPSYMTDDQMAKLGYLYNWAAAVGVEDCSDFGASPFSGNRQGICPNDWHVPTKSEWQALRDYIEPTEMEKKTAGTQLKTTSGWKNSGNGTDIYDFSGLPAGNAWTDEIGYVGTHAYFWSATPHQTETAYAYPCVLMNTTTGLGFVDGYDMSYGQSVRCLKNN